MGLLDQIKGSKKDNRNVVVTTRLSEEEARKFNDLCDANDHKVAEAVRLLILNEIYPERHISDIQPTRQVRQTPKRVPKPEPIWESAEEDATEDAEMAPRPAPPKIRSYNPTSRPGGKWTYKPWLVEGDLPCPICEEWKSASNMSRHAKSAHGMESTQELFNMHQEKVDQMFADATTAPETT